ncbi:MAG: hypothetical protein FWC19_02575 [Treponema sp.]|nr:hypothetical protein [Treponema sp.]
MKKGIILTILLVSVLSISFPQTGDTYSVSNVSTWIEAVNGVRSGGNNREYTIIVTANVSVPPSSENTFGSVTGIKINMEGNGSLSPSNNGVLLIIGTDQTIVAKNVSLRGRSNNGSFSVVRVMNGSMFQMEGNASITGNSIDGVGGGVLVEGGTFIMKDDASVSSNVTNNGNGGGVHVSSGTLIMQDNATVSRNTATGYYSGGQWRRAGGGQGGGVYSNGTFTMHGNASVSGNTVTINSRSDGWGTARCNGGGVFNQGTFNMHDNSTVTGNTSSAIDGYGGGGGIYNGGTLTMQNSATVTNNKSISNNSGYFGGAGGGGVYNDGGTFTIKESASVFENNASFNGGGIYNRGILNMRNNASVSNNTCGIDNSGGGGVFVYSGTFTMYESTLVSGNIANLGGGVYINGDSLYRNRGTFIMQDNAIISGNIANISGGGVYINSSENFIGTFNMQGSAIISNNNATYYGGGVFSNGTFAKSGGIIYGDDAEQTQINTVISKFGHAIYEPKNGGWRNASAGSTMNTDSYGFWLNDGDIVRFLFSETVSESTWRRSNFNNTLTLTHNMIKSSSSNNLWVLQSISGNAYTFRRSNATNMLTITIRFENNNLVISGDSGSGQDNWNGTWARR